MGNRTESGLIRGLKWGRNPLALAIAATLAASPVWAEEQDADELQTVEVNAEQSDDAYGGDDFGYVGQRSMTAMKTDTPVSETPRSVSIVTREQMDDYAIQSLTRAKAAIEAGQLTEEIIPVTIKTRRGESVVEQDEQPFNANIEKIPSLRAAFAKDGTITAANASSISDGASALVLMRESEAEARGIKPMARIVAHTTQSQHPSEFTLAPVGAIEKLFAKSGWTKDDVDLYEINEAFAMVAMLPILELGLDPETVNIFGGACAQGHPVGSTGSRILVTLMNALKIKGKTKGVAALCIGGGEATAMAIELV